MERGYVKLWRKSLDSPIFKNPELFCFWSYCLMKASHKKFKVLVGLTMVELEPGQFVFGRQKASIETGLSERKIRTCLEKLKNFGNLTSKTTNKFSIISIINWGTYQSEKEDTDQQNDQQVTNNRPTSDQQVTTYKNNKHIENNENLKTPIVPKPKKPKIDLSDYLQEKIIENNFIETKDKIFEFFEYRMAMPKAKQYKTEKGINGLFRNMNECRDSGLIVSDCLEIAMEKGWQSFESSYYKNGNQSVQKLHTLNKFEQNTQTCKEWADGK